MAKKQPTQPEEPARPKLGRPPVDSSAQAIEAAIWARQGLTNAEIAVKLKCSERTVSRLLAAAKILPPGPAPMDIRPASTPSDPAEQPFQDLILPRSGQAPLKIRGRLVARATGMYWNAKPGKPNSDWWEVSIFALDRSDAYAVAIAYRKSFRGQSGEHHTAEITATPAAVLQAYDPLKVLIGFPSSERFASQQRDLELDCTRQYQSLVSTVLADFPEDATSETDKQTNGQTDAARLAAAVDEIRKQLAKMADQQRVELFDRLEQGYCPSCGSDKLPCPCDRDK